MGLVIGRSSNYQKNFEVLPGITDADTDNTIKIIIRTLMETIQIHKGQRITQLLLLPLMQVPNPILKPKRGDGQSDSTEGAYLMQDLSERPFKTLLLNGKKFRGLMDTDADKTYIAASDWPNSWPVHKTGSSLLGLGSASRMMQSSALLKWKDKGKEGMIQPYVLPTLPFTLWGKDMLESMDIKLITSDQISSQNFS